MLSYQIYLLCLISQVIKAHFARCKHFFLIRLVPIFLDLNILTKNSWIKKQWFQPTISLSAHIIKTYALQLFCRDLTESDSLHSRVMKAPIRLRKLFEVKCTRSPHGASQRPQPGHIYLHELRRSRDSLKLIPAKALSEAAVYLPVCKPGGLNRL